MKKPISLLVAIVWLGLITGCIEFERQTMSYRHDAATDTLYIFQDYQGIFGGDEPASLSENELDQFSSVMRGGRTFFFNNWITEFNRQFLIEKEQTAKGELDPDPAYESAIRTLIDLALANVQIENVGFYFNAQHRLCGSQRVTVKNVSKVLTALNKVLLFFARDQAEEKDKSEQEKELLRKYAKSGQNTLHLDGNRLEIRWPVVEQDYREFKDKSPHAQAIRATGGDIAYDEGLITLTLGKTDAKSVSLTLPFSEKPYVDNCIAQAKIYGIKESFDATAAAKAFLEGAAAAEQKPK